MPLPCTDDMFTYHVPTAEQILWMQEIRVQAKCLAEAINVLPIHPDYLKEALLSLHQATMLANAGMVLYNK